MLGREDIESDIIVGIANPHREEIEQLCQAPNLHFLSGFPIWQILCVNGRSLGAGGSTTWGTLLFGLLSELQS